MGEVVKSHFGHLQKLFVKGLEHRSCSCGHGLEGVTSSACVAGVRRDPMVRQPRASLWPIALFSVLFLSPSPPAFFHSSPGAGRRGAQSPLAGEPLSCLPCCPLDVLSGRLCLRRRQLSGSPGCASVCCACGYNLLVLEGPVHHVRLP